MGKHIDATGPIVFHENVGTADLRGAESGTDHSKKTNDRITNTGGNPLPICNKTAE